MNLIRFKNNLTKGSNSNGLSKSPKKQTNLITNNYQTITKSTTITHGIVNSQSYIVQSNRNPSLQHQMTTSTTTQSSSRSSTPSKSMTNSSSKHESRLPTPRSSRASLGPAPNLNTTQTLNVTSVSAKSKSPSNFMSRNLQLSKPPPAPSNNSMTPSQNLQNGRSGRVLQSYGGQRSATTSIVPTQSQTNTRSQPQIKQQQQQTRPTQQMSRTSTNQSIASNSSSTTNATSPSSSSSLSASSSIHQIAPLNASSPRSRNQSPSSLLSQMSLNSVNNNKIMNSPSGLFTDGPLARRPVMNASPLRDRDRDRERSASPLRQIGSQLNLGSNSNLQTIQESRIPSNLLNSPMAARKLQLQQKQVRKSFLPQPVSYAGSQNQSRQSSISPIR